MAIFGHVDASTVLGAMKQEGEGTRADRLKLVRSHFNYLEKHKHYIEKIDGKRGWWRLTPAGEAAVNDKTEDAA